ncbi:hypothetical protein AB9F26_05965 [Falsihalocynthiibacter sp. BN13B15]|uniref:hypothetical protein n=1 Tax=Falsihalocynthiibacter sp. BN13B15 TaxID=3240871 RepID=UPI00350F2E37
MNDTYSNAEIVAAVGQPNWPPSDDHEKTVLYFRFCIRRLAQVHGLKKLNAVIFMGNFGDFAMDAPFRNAMKLQARYLSSTTADLLQQIQDR